MNEFMGPVPQTATWLDEGTFDFDSDGRVDTRLRHGYEGRPFALSRSTVDMLERAQGGLRQSQAAALDIRATILQAIDDPNNDQLVRRLQARIDGQLEAMRWISRDTNYGGSIGFEHLPGRYAFTDSPETLQVIEASPETQVGEYSFTVESPARRAHVEAMVRQEAPLSSDERIVLNGTMIPLSQGMTQLQIVNAINTLSDETGVLADIADSGATRLYSETFGTDYNVQVASTLQATTDSSGFGTSFTSARGTDLAIVPDLHTYHVSGNQVELLNGKAKGLVFRVPADGSQPVDSVTGALGKISVVQDPLDPRVVRSAKPPQIQNRPLLDGSAGRNLVATDTSVVALRASADTAPGAYALAVTTKGERASIEASIPQSSGLRRDEVLVVNGVAISLAAKSTQSQVVDTINNESEITGVLAEVNAGMTRLYSDRFGSGSSITVVSNQEGAADSSGIGTTPLSANGVDLIVDIDANQWTANGNTVKPNGGAERGLVLRFLPDPTDQVSTAWPGAVGIVGVFERPLSFPAAGTPEEKLEVFLPDVRPRAYELDDISILTRTGVNDALLTVDHALRELNGELGKLEGITDSTPLAAGISDIGSDSGTQFVSEDGYIIKLNENDVVGPDSLFDESGVIDASGLYPNSWDVGEGYLGFAVPFEDDFQFGWMRLEVGENASMTVKDYAIETTKGTPIWIGGTLQLTPLIGDFDNDGSVAFSDFLQFSRVFGSTTTQLGNQNPDFDGSGKVDFADFLKFSSAFQSTISVDAVPEPRSLSMLALAFAIIFQISRASVARKRLRSSNKSKIVDRYLRWAPSMDGTAK